MKAGENMSETQEYAEMKELLHKATNDVVKLYLSDQVIQMLDIPGSDHQGSNKRDALWMETAQEHSVFASQILNLSGAMKIVGETMRSYPQNSEIFRILFSGIRDNAAIRLLGDVLFSRTIVSPGNLDNGMNLVSEAEIMATEMALKEGWRSTQAQGVTLDQIVSAILQGHLRVEHQANTK